MRVQRRRHVRPGVVSPRGRQGPQHCSPDIEGLHELEPLDFSNTQFEHLYSNAVQHYFRTLQVIMVIPKRKLLAESPFDGISDAVFATSRDGVRFDRPFMEDFIRPGRNSLNWYSRTNVVVTELLPAATEKFSLDGFQADSHSMAHLQHHVIRTDGLVSVHGDYQRRELLTKLLQFSGSRLFINYPTSSAGSVHREITDAQGTALAGNASKDCEDLCGDQIEWMVAWKNGSNVSTLARRVVWLRFLLRDTDLYSFHFGR